MKLDGRGLDAFLRRPDPALRAFLVYGPDEGLVRERVEALGRTVLEDLRDPFRAADLAAETIAADPGRLLDEACAMALTGGRRLVMVRGAGDRLSAACEALLEAPSVEALVLVAAGDLPGRSSLRKLFEGARNAASLACYQEDARAVAATLKALLAEQGVSADADTLAWAGEALQGDRGLQRRAAELLATYAGPRGRLTLADAMALLGDAGSAEVDDAVEAACGGDPARLETALGRLFGEGVASIQLLRAVQTHLRRLHLARSRLDAGQSLDEAIKGMSPPIFFRAAPEFRRQLQGWNLARLAAALDAVAEAEAACKRTGAADRLLTQRAFLALAASSPAGRRR